MRNQSPVPPASPMTEGFTLGEFLAVLWDGRWILAGTVVLALALGAFYLWRVTPVYQMEALIQVEARPATQARPALEGKVEGLSDVGARARSEIEILQSNQVLGRVVEALRLDLVAEPVPSRITGTARIRGKRAPKLEVASFDVPDTLRGEAFRLEARSGDAYAWLDEDGHHLAEGKVGALVQITYAGKPLKLIVASLKAKPGQQFDLVRQHLLNAIEDVRGNLAVSEKGKETDILALSYQDTDPVRGAAVLNAILDQYTRENIERRTQEASKTLAILQEQKAGLRDRQTRAEQNLSRFRSGSRSVDLGEEARLVLQRSVEIERDILALSQKRQELLRTYQPEADVVMTLDQQVAALKAEKAKLDSKGRSLPQTQQEAVRLMQDVQVNQEHYNALVNLEALNAQQLQMARAGDIANARVVDRALPSLRPVKPQRRLVMGASFIVGLVLGGGILLLRRLLSRTGIEDPQVLEAAFGLPLLATIPHSDNQSLMDRQPRKEGEDPELLSTAHAEDLAVESLRSLRTSLHFTMVDAPNKAVMIAGSSPEIGKSFVSANFAVILGQYGAKVLLIDADMRKGKLHRTFGAGSRKNGLSEVLAGRRSWRDVLHSTRGIDLISTGTLPPDPSKLLLTDRFKALVEETSAAYDYVLVDAPPVLAVTDAAIIAAHMGAVVLLAKDGQHSLREIRAALQNLELAGVKAKGFVFNDMDITSARLNYHRYAYHYTYKSYQS